MGSNISWTLATAVMLATEKIPEASQNNANQAAVVEFWFWIENLSCETIFVKMVCKLLKFIQRDSNVFVYWKVYTKNSAIALFFGGFLQFAHHFKEHCLTIFHSKFDHCSSARTWGKKLNCIKTSPYLAKIRLSKHSQDKSQELHVFCKCLALLCFELSGFENPRT